jgi:hypothetical protein
MPDDATAEAAEVSRETVFTAVGGEVELLAPIPTNRRDGGDKPSLLQSSKIEAGRLGSPSIYAAVVQHVRQGRAARSRR